MAVGPVSSQALSMMTPRSIDGPAPFDRIQQGPEKLEEPNAFQALFEETVGKTNSALNAAESQAKAFAEGQSDDIHGTMIAVSEADIQLRLLGTMKNKVVEAFYELWRMQI